MPPDRIYQRGEFVKITADDDRSVTAMVAMASPCGRSLFLLFDGMLDGHVGAMPLLYRDESHAFVSVVTGKPVTLEKEQRT